MKIYRCQDYQEMSLVLARLLAAHIRLRPTLRLGLATGSTPEGAYAELIRMHQEEGLDFSQLTSINLDEYIGLAAEHPQSYRSFMNAKLFDHVNIKKAQTFVPSGVAEDPKAEALAYEAMISAMDGIDVQLLGLGANGHLAFNEPADSFAGPCHVVDLVQETLEANARFFASKEEVPKQAITMGLGQIMKARQLILAVSGAGKAKALQAALEGPITPQLPASILQLHSDVSVVADAEAAAGLQDF